MEDIPYSIHSLIYIGLEVIQAVTRPFLQVQFIHKRHGTCLVLFRPSQLSSLLYIRTCNHFANTEFPFCYPSNRVHFPRMRLFPRFSSQTQAESPLVFPSMSIIHGKRQCDAICRLSIDTGFHFFSGGSFFPDFPFSLFVFE